MFSNLLSWSMYWKNCEIMVSCQPPPPPTPPPPLHLILLVYCMQSLDLLGEMGGGGYMEKWKYQAGYGEVGVTSTLCSTCQFAALRNGLCTRWQFRQCQCQIVMFPAVHRMAVLPVPVSVFNVLCNASGRLSIGWQFCASGTVMGAKLPLLAQRHLVSDTLAQNWTAAMQPGILFSEKNETKQKDLAYLSTHTVYRYKIKKNHYFGRILENGYRKTKFSWTFIVILNWAKRLRNWWMCSQNMPSPNTHWLA